MPKVTPYTDTIEQSIRATIGGVLCVLDMSQEQLAAAMGIDKKTLGNKINDVRTFRVWELEKIIEVARGKGYKCQFTIGSRT